MNGSTVEQYFVPLVGGMQAVYNGSGLQYYRHSDWLGTNRFAATPAGTVYFDGAYAPFGENYAGMGTSDQVFTGQPMGTVSGLYDFTFREYSSAQGRWLVPDPAGLAAVDISNPQTWNRYAYVMNNPLSYVDPLGLKLGICPDGLRRASCPWGGYGDSGFGGYDTTVWGSPTGYCCFSTGGPENPDGMEAIVIFPFAGLPGLIGPPSPGL